VPQPDADLESLMTQARELPAGQTSAGPAVPTTSFIPQSFLPTRRAGTLDHINYAHDQMIDLILANPGITQNAIAAAVGYSASWVSTVMVTDAFQARLADRRNAVVDPHLRDAVREGFEKIVARSQEILLEKLSQPSSVVPFNAALQAAAVSSRALGYGARPEPSPVAPLADKLIDHADRLVALLRREKSRVVEGTAVESQEAPSGNQAQPA